MAEVVTATDKHSPRNKRDMLHCDCGALIEKGGFLAKAEDDATGAIRWLCRSCADKLPWTNEAEAETGVKWRDFVPTVNDVLDLNTNVPRWFVKALKHSEAIRWAYLLGKHRGENQ
jgi:hypothetical protein